MFDWKAQGDWQDYCQMYWHSLPNSMAGLAILKKADWTCVDCGFQSLPITLDEDETVDFSLPEQTTGFMQVRHCDGDHDNFTASNLECVCPFCHLSDHAVDAVVTGKAELILAPWMTQGDLNNLARSIHVCHLKEAHPYYAESESIWQELSLLGNRLNEYIHGFPKEGSTRLGNQKLFMRALELVPDAHDNKDVLLKPLRLLPKPDFFHEAIQFWSDTQYNKISRSTWEGLVHECA